MTAREAVIEVKNRLEESNIPSALLDAELIVGRAAGMTRALLLAHPERELDEKESGYIRDMLKKRLSRIPMQYILGSCEFMGFNFNVNRSTLIPRSDTETVVEKAIDIIKEKKYKTALDIGTGSGAIAVSIAKYTDTAVTASDISQSAIDTARLNAEQNNVSVDFVKSDMFSELEGRFDIIISNPPYIERDVIKTLEPEVRKYEPITALDGGEDGLCFYRVITKEAPKHLNKGGALIFEIGCNQAYAVKKLMKINNFDEISVNKDLSGLDRVVIGFKIC